MNTVNKTQAQGGDAEKGAPGMLHEADIGSGEKTPGEHETNDIIRSIPALPETQAPKPEADAAS